MSDRQLKALGVLACAAVLATVAQRTMKAEAAIVGLSSLELALFGGAVSALVTRMA